MATENKYARGKIYRLVNSVDDDIYVGSTCDMLAKRLYGHKSMAKKHGERRVYQHLNAIGWENVSIVLVEEYSCENKMQLERRERYWIDELKPTLNKNTIMTQQEYQEYRAKYQAKYKADNAEKLREYHAQYYAENADKVQERQVKYREANRDAINARRREQYVLKKQQATNQAS